jgi:ribosomal protein S3
VDALRQVMHAGAEGAEVEVTQSLNIAHVEGEEFFVDGMITATASGRPALGRAAASG